MRAIRMAGVLVLGLVLAAALSACQKKSETAVSSTTAEQNPAMAEETPATGTTTPPEGAPAQPATPASKPPVKSTGSASTKGNSTPPTPAVPAADTRSISVAAGTVFDVTLTTPVNTATSNVGDKIEATLLQPLTAADGYVIANLGAVIRGEISELKRASKSKSEEDRAMVKLSFTSIETVDGEKTLNATVTNSEGQMTAGGTGKRDALVIGGSAALGAILGKIIGKDTKGAVIGAVGGAVLGTGAMMASKGHELDVPAGSKITLRADEPVTVVAK